LALAVELAALRFHEIVDITWRIRPPVPAIERGRDRARPHPPSAFPAAPRAVCHRWRRMAKTRPPPSTMCPGAVAYAGGRPLRPVVSIARAPIALEFVRSSFLQRLDEFDAAAAIALFAANARRSRADRCPRGAPGDQPVTRNPFPPSCATTAAQGHEDRGARWPTRFVPPTGRTRRCFRYAFRGRYPPPSTAAWIHGVRRAKS